MASAVSVTAQMVGHAFVNQYYGVLQQFPALVHRFYTDASRLTRAEYGPDGLILNARSQAEIHNTVMATIHDGCKADIITIDSLESFGGSVIVLVTGIMHKNKSRRNFVQTFFLAPQERGYYVLNDIFRYLDEEPPAVVQVPKVADLAHEMYERLQLAPEADRDLRNVTLGGMVKETTVPETSIPEYVDHHQGVVKGEQHVIDGNNMRPTMDTISNERLVSTTDQYSTVDDIRSTYDDGSNEKKSYASILRHQRENSTQHSTTPMSYQTTNEQPNHTHHSNSSAGLLSNPPTGSHIPEENTNLSNESGAADLKSVYIKNLPVNVTESHVEEDLMKVGCSRPINVILKNHKDGGVYAFVDFDDSGSARNAIEASPVFIGGRKAHIEERKSTYSGAPSRGRGRGSGRGLSNANSRGRNSYSSGRGYGDGETANRGRSRGGYGGSHA